MAYKERYLNVPYSILTDVRLSSRAKLVYAFIQGFDRGDCRVTDVYLAELLNTSPRGIQRDIKQLKENDLVYTKFRTNDGKVVGRTLFVKGAKVQTTDNTKDGWV